MSEVRLQVASIVEGTSVDGPGLRTSIYFSGCTHRCSGCHNPDTWDPSFGKSMTIEEIMDVVRRNDFNVTFSGGDPLLQIEPLKILAKEIKEYGKNIWCYTGYIFEEIVSDNRFKEVLDLIDVLVDGPFIEGLKDRSLRFRGSRNQRLIDCRKSNESNVVLLADIS